MNAQAHLSNRAEVLALLGEAKSTTDSYEKLQFLGQVHDLVFKEPALLAEILPMILEMHTDQAPSTRKWVISVIEEIGFRHAECRWSFDTSVE